ncbi:VENN motif pre-toxin domain-containing protein, partial [Neisseriaceae bacterium ESL0693]|nr:VENN motif pre-toxin domain-containing protein [Neisseriaceae bacterium ESL0693]
GASGSADYSHSKINADYAAVTEQSGLFAGDGGYQVNVSGHTQLTGALITSTDKAEQTGKNQFTTGTIGFTDLHNHSNYKGEGIGIGLSGDINGGANGQTVDKNGNATNSLMAGIGYGSDKGNDASTTHSGINTSNISITNPDKQQQDINQVHTDVSTDNYAEHAGYLSNNFDKDRVQSELDTQIDVSKEFSQNTQKAQAEINQKKDQLKDKIKHETDPAKLNEYQQQLDNWNTASWLLGSISAGLSAPTNNVAGIAAATASPAVAHAIGDYFHDHGSEDSAAHLLAHAALGAAVAAAGGNNALVGAASAAGSEAAAPALAHWLYGKDAADLTTEEKQTISSIVGLASAAIGAATGNSADIASGAQIGQNAVDNNYLSEHQQKQRDKELIECQGKLCKIKVNGKWLAISGAQQASLTAGIVAGVPVEIGQSMEDLLHMVTSPIETYNAIKSLINSDDIFGNVSDALKQEYSKRIDNLINQYEQAGASGSFQAGVEIGRLLTDAGTLVAGGIGVGKGVAKVTEKVVSKISKQGVGYSEALINNGIKLEIDPNKFNYLYGNVSSGIHNIDRSTQLAQTMRKLGIEQNDSGTQILIDHFNTVVNTKNNIVNTYSKGSQNFEVRESLLFGPSGKAVKLETSFEVMPNGSRRFITTIPKEGKK